MAEQQSRSLSPDTLAILAELKKQGDMTRRDERTYSIKGTNARLDKLGDLFGSISSTIESQIDTLKEASGFSRQAAVAQEEQNRLLELAGISEQERAELEKRRFQTAQLKEDQDRKDQEEREKKRADNEKGFYSKLSNVFSKKGFGSLMTGIKWAAIGAVLAPLGYQFVAGILEGMGVDVKKFEDGFVEGFNSFVGFLKEVDWGALITAFNVLATPMGIAGAMGLSALPGILDAAQMAALGYALKRSGGGAPPPSTTTRRTGPYQDAQGRWRDAQGRFTTAPTNSNRPMGGLTRPTIRGAGIAGLAATALSAILPSLGNYIRTEYQGMSPEDLENRKFDYIDAGGAVVTGATLGMMFGPMGALAGAVLGGVYSIGKAAADWVEENNKSDITKELENALEDVSKTNDEYQKKLEKRAELEKTLSEAQLENLGLGQAQLEAELLEIEAKKKEAIKSATERDQELKDQIEAKKAEMKRVSEDTSLRETSVYVPYQGNVKTTETEEQALARRNAAVERLQQEIADLENQKVENIETTAREANVPMSAIYGSIAAASGERLRNLEEIVTLINGENAIVNGILNTLAARAGDVSDVPSQPIVIQDNSTNTSVGPTTNVRNNNSSSSFGVLMTDQGGGNGNAFGSVSG